MVQGDVELLFYIDGKNVTAPNNWMETELEASFEKNEPRISNLQYEFFGDAVDILLAWKLAGITLTNGIPNGPGVTEGPSFNIVSVCDGVMEPVFNGCIDLTRTTFPQYDLQPVVKAIIIERGGIDHLASIGGAFRYEYLTTKPIEAAKQSAWITEDDYVRINYVIGHYPQYIEIILGSLSVYILLKEFFEIGERIAKIAKDIADIIQAATSFSGFAAIIADGLDIAAILLYEGLVIVALFEIVSKLFTFIFPFVYYHKGMLIKTLFQKGCDYLGITLKSSILDQLDAENLRLAYMPIKLTNGALVGKETIVGLDFETTDLRETGLYPGTFTDFLKEMEEFFAAKVHVIAGVLYFESEVGFELPSQFDIPQVCIQDYTINADEIIANYFITYTQDGNDLWSFEGSNNFNYQVTVSQKVTNDIKNRQLKGIKEVRLPYSQSTVKTEKSSLESIMTDVYDGFADVVNKIGTLVNGHDALPTIDKSTQIGCLILDTHFTNSPRLVLLNDEGKVRSDFNSIFGASQLWAKYHFRNSPVPQIGNPKGNQWLRYQSDLIPMCCQDFFNLTNRNYGTYKGAPARITNIKYKPFSKSAQINFEINQTYTLNLQETFIQDGVTQ